MLLRVSAAFFSLLSLKYITYSFSFRLSLLPACCRAPPCSLLHSPGARPSVSLSPPSLPAFPPLVFRCLLLLPCVVWWLPCLVPSPSISLYPRLARPEALRRPSVCPAVFRADCPSLVSYKAQNSVTVWADAPRICPRPCLLLPMCCRVFRCPFRGFRPSVRVCVLLPCVVWWQ